MSIFGSILGKIFGHAEAATPSAPPPAGSTSTFNNPAPVSPAPGQSVPPPPAPAAGSAPASTAASTQTVDVAAILNDLASKNAQKLDWHHSIVDLMKLLGLDSSLSNRQELAKELHYTGSTEDSASMNIWLHKQVMQKLAEHGGTVPDDLK